MDPPPPNSPPPNTPQPQPRSSDNGTDGDQSYFGQFISDLESSPIQSDWRGTPSLNEQAAVEESEPLFSTQLQTLQKTDGLTEQECKQLTEMVELGIEPQVKARQMIAFLLRLSEFPQDSGFQHTADSKTSFLGPHGDKASVWTCIFRECNQCWGQQVKRTRLAAAE